jgi:hypothetical protein
METENMIGARLTTSGRSPNSKVDTGRSEEVRSRKRILHVYPAAMEHHLATMIGNTNVVFSNFENQTVLVAPVARDPRVSKLAQSLSLSLLSPVSTLLLIVRRRSDFVVFHSGFWPKFWFVASAATLVGARPIWICWGGELKSSGGLKGRINAGLKAWTIPRFFRSVFLAASDQARADNLCGRKVESVVVPYYNPSYLSGSNLSSGRAFDSSMVRVQIGNDGSAVNDHLACLAELSRVRKLAFTVVYPLGYGRFDAQYIEHLKTTSQRSLAVQCEFIDHLLPPVQFDMLIDSCDALLLASREQRGLYSIYRYLAAGKPVFLPKDAKLRRDLQDLGFRVEALESLGTMDASMFSDLCTRKCEANVLVARECLGMEAIRRTWEKVILTAGS